MRLRIADCGMDEMRNAECGVRNRSHDGRALRPTLGIEPAMQFRIPHSAFRIRVGSRIGGPLGI